MTRKIFIENGIISLCEYYEADYRVIYDSWVEDDTVIGYNFRMPYSFDEYYAQCKESTTWGAVIIRNEDKVVIGRVGVSSGYPDLTITIFKEYRSFGYGSMAFSLAIKYCFEELNFEEIYAGCYEDNISSRRMIENCGFIPHPEGNLLEKHIITGEDRWQYDFVLRNHNNSK